MARKAKKVRTPKLSRKFDTKFIGKEPENLDFTADEGAFGHALQWYGYMLTPADAKRYLVATGRRKDVVESLEPRYFAGHMQIAWLCRMQSRNCTLREDSLAKIEEFFESVLDELVAKQAHDRENARPRRARIPAASLVLADIEELFYAGEEISVDVIAAKHNASPAALRSVAEDLKELLAEYEELASMDFATVEREAKRRMKVIAKLDAAYERDDEDLIVKLEAELAEFNDYAIQLHEAYAHLTQRQRVARRDVLRAVCQACGAKAVKERVARKPKPVPVEKQVRFIKYLPEARGRKSRTPDEIIGAKRIWVWHEKYQLLIWFESETGFGAAGASITGVTASGGKKVRKPDQVLSDFAGAPSRRRAVYESLKTTAFTPSTRFSENHLILAVEK